MQMYCLSYLIKMMKNRKKYDVKKEPDRNPARVYYPISYEKPDANVMLSIKYKNDHRSL